MARPEPLATKLEEKLDDIYKELTEIKISSKEMQVTLSNLTKSVSKSDSNCVETHKIVEKRIRWLEQRMWIAYGAITVLSLLATVSSLGLIK
jgi:uncharacterized coiled-coil protein SlyX